MLESGQAFRDCLKVDHGKLPFAQRKMLQGPKRRRQRTSPSHAFKLPSLGTIQLQDRHIRHHAREPTCQVRLHVAQSQ
eukprot:scaffold674709_cov98-Prasinocladus_malaysianus.AAC.1